MVILVFVQLKAKLKDIFMASLSPAESAGLANKVYDVKNEEDWKNIAKLLENSSQAAYAGFDKNPTRIVGQSGWGKSSGFAYLANGSGNRVGESLFAIRGTASLADALTDMRVSFARSPSGYVVHRGFALTFESIKPEINNYLKKNSPSHIHVLGHSLGGAVACLTAEYLKLLGNSVSLYTFGCPRVGDSLYSTAITQLIGDNNIHRVYHEADPVSMIPLFPFVPVSNKNNGYQLPWKGWTVSFYAHKMENYISSVGTSSWQSLPRVQVKSFFTDIDAWLEEVAENGGGIKMLSCSALQQILRALRWILSAICDVSIMAAQFAASGAAVAVDILAYLLYNGCLLSVRIAGYVNSILKAILRFLGRAINIGTNITVYFIRFVLDMFFRTISTAASQSVRMLYL